MNIFKATQDFERWLAKQLPIVSQDLRLKHANMAEAPFPFFRATFYRWLQLWTEVCGDLAKAPTVLGVGDLHIENFGTWRDAEGRLCWGVNDFDEADTLPYTNDLVRLAASARVAHKSGAVDVKFGDACAAILTGFRDCLSAGGRPFVLEERHAQLRAMAMAADRDPSKFWSKLTELLGQPPSEPPASAIAALARVFPTANIPFEYRIRPRVGMGSLGRPRYVALAEWAGGWLCREVKAAAPPATLWAKGETFAGPLQIGTAVGRAIRSPDPFYQPTAQWVARRLGPRSSRIELAGLATGEAGRVLEAMGMEVANVHAGTPGAGAAILADLDARRPDWLSGAGKLFAALIEEDWAAWTKATGG
jgi:hypothetical protein